MDADEAAQQVFEEHRPRLRSIAHRILGSTGEADDAVQEAWLRFARQDAGTIENSGGWLTTVVARIALNLLRARDTRSELPLDDRLPDPVVGPADGTDPEHEALLADAVGLALHVVLDTLEPAERMAFVLHDMFGVPFADIGTIVDRSPEAARQLASRARRRVRAADPASAPDPERQRAVVDAFLAAARDGDFEGLLGVLDPDVVVRTDSGEGALDVVRGARAVAGQAQAFGRGDLVARAALVNGAVGIVSVRDGRPFSVGDVVVREGRIVAIDFLLDAERLAGLDLGFLDT